VSNVEINDVEALKSHCRNIFFDLIVLNIETAALTQTKEMYKTLRGLYKTLKTVPILLSLPVVVMTGCQHVETVINKLATHPVYRVGEDEVAKTELLQTIELIHYLSYRY